MKYIWLYFPFSSISNLLIYFLNFGIISRFSDKNKKMRIYLYFRSNFFIVFLYNQKRKYYIACIYLNLKILIDLQKLNMNYKKKRAGDVNLIIFYLQNPKVFKILKKSDKSICIM